MQRSMRAGAMAAGSARGGGGEMCQGFVSRGRERRAARAGSSGGGFSSLRGDTAPRRRENRGYLCKCPRRRGASRATSVGAARLASGRRPAVCGERAPRDVAVAGREISGASPAAACGASAGRRERIGPSPRGARARPGLAPGLRGGGCARARATPRSRSRDPPDLPARRGPPSAPRDPGVTSASAAPRRALAPLPPPQPPPGYPPRVPRSARCARGGGSHALYPACAKHPLLPLPSPPPAPVPASRSRTTYPARRYRLAARRPRHPRAPRFRSAKSRPQFPAPDRPRLPATITPL